MNYLAVLGRQPDLSLAELSALGFQVQEVHDLPEVSLAELTYPVADFPISRLGGTQKLAVPLESKPLDYLSSLPAGKITFGISDYSKNASPRGVSDKALKIKRILARHGHSVRTVYHESRILSSATSLHNGLSGQNPRKVELIQFGAKWYHVIGVQDIDAYARRDQVRPARDAKVGMLPPKLAQILINLCGPLPEGVRILDPFCGTGVLLQEALLMGYRAYGTDISPRMIEYSEKNLHWLVGSQDNLFLGHSAAYERGLGREPRDDGRSRPGPRNKLSETQANSQGLFDLSVADATNFTWQPPINAVACESYLGRPFSHVPTDMALKEQKQECRSIILGFLTNLALQIAPATPVTIAIPAWLRQDGAYSRLEILDDIENLGYNVDNKSREGLFYYRNGQVVARDIIILRKK